MGWFCAMMCNQTAFSIQRNNQRSTHTWNRNLDCHTVFRMCGG